MKLHILTACTRPENLFAIAQSFAHACSSGVDLAWHIRLDPTRQCVGGQALKNAMLDAIQDGWVWICDDDNAAHEDFFERLAQTVHACPAAQLIVCAQRMPLGGIRQVHRSMLRETHIDAAQIVVRREAIGDTRIPEHYCGDGAFIEALARQIPDDRMVFIRDPIVFYNRLRGDT